MRARARMPNSAVQGMMNGILEALWLSSWADAMDEMGKPTPRNITAETADPPPASAKKIAKEYAKALAAVNNGSLTGIYLLAMEHEPGCREIDPRELGYYLTMEGLGHGVSWWDDHPKFPVNIPNVSVMAGKSGSKWFLDSGGIDFRFIDKPLSWEKGQWLLKKIQGGAGEKWIK